MEELKEQLNLPKIGGYLIAYVKDVYIFATKENKKEYFSKLVFIIPGTDNRYNPGIATFDSADPLISAFEKSISQMNLLKNQSFMGEYSKVISDTSSSKIEVKANNGHIEMLFWAYSDGKYMFSRKLSFDEVNKSIEILKSTYQKAENMKNTLRALTSE